MEITPKKLVEEQTLVMDLDACGAKPREIPWAFALTVRKQQLPMVRRDCLVLVLVTR
jgi:hypothetical protein